MRGRWLASVGASCVALAASCSPNFSAKTCATDSDCGSLVCEMSGGQPACVPVESASIHVGMSAPLSGPNQELGTDMKLGVTLAFDAQNAAGGIRGRQLVLDFRDDQYEPDLAEAAARALVNVQPTHAAPALHDDQRPDRHRHARGIRRRPSIAGRARCSRSSATWARRRWCALRRCRSRRAPSSSAPSPAPPRSCATPRRAPRARSTSSTCARATPRKRTRRSSTSFSRTSPDYQHIISFDQNDSFGQAGYSGLVAAYTAIKGSFGPSADPTNPIARFRYTRNDTTSVPAQVTGAAAYIAQLLAADSAPHTIGIMMTDTYGAAVDFITGLRQWQFAADAQQASLQKATRLTLLFSNVSFVGPNALAAGLKSAGHPPGAVRARPVHPGRRRLPGRAQLPERHERHRERVPRPRRQRAEDRGLHVARGLRRRDHLDRRADGAPGAVHARVAHPDDRELAGPEPGPRRHVGVHADQSQLLPVRVGYGHRRRRQRFRTSTSGAPAPPFSSSSERKTDEETR